ncbi:hypothetical protein [Nocardia sp. NPDC023733]
MIAGGVEPADDRRGHVLGEAGSLWLGDEPLRGRHVGESPPAVVVGEYALELDTRGGRTKCDRRRRGPEEGRFEGCVQLVQRGVRCLAGGEHDQAWGLTGDEADALGEHPTALLEHLGSARTAQQ